MIHEGRVENHRETATVKVLSQDYHRNGVGGEGFVASLFDVIRDDGTTQRMIAMSFGRNRQDFITQTGVVDVNLLADEEVGVTFGLNSWRGSDHYGPILADCYEQNGYGWEEDET